MKQDKSILISKELHKRVKLTAIERGTNVKTLVAKAILSDLNGNGNLNKATQGGEK